MAGNLNNKQRAFVEYYLICWNGSEAARRAGYTGNVNVTASRLLTKANISKAIQVRLSDLHMTADEVLERLTRQGRGSLAPFLTPNAEGYDLTTDQAQAELTNIRRYKIKRRVTIQKNGDRIEELEQDLELYDAQRANELLGKHHALFANVDLDGDEVDDWREYARQLGVAEADAIAEAEAILAESAHVRGRTKGGKKAKRPGPVGAGLGEQTAASGV